MIPIQDDPNMHLIITYTRTALGAEQPFGRGACSNNVNVKRNSPYDTQMTLKVKVKFHLRYTQGST